MKRSEFISKAAVFTTVAFFPAMRLWGSRAAGSRDKTLWIELIDYARWCPSPHNVQPWKMKLISPSEAHLYYDPSRVPDVVDHDTAFTIAGMAMFIECLDISARKHGYKIRAEHEQEQHLDCKGAEPKLFAKLYLTASYENETTDRELIKKRRTSRLNYDGKILPGDAIASFTSIAAQYGHKLVYSSDKEMIKYVTQLNSKSILHELGNDAEREEMSRWIRTTDKDAQLHKDGLSYRCLATSERLLNNFLYKYQRFTKGWKRSYAEHVLNKSMNGTANLAWITGAFGNRNDWVNAGIMLQKLWMDATARNIYIHPLGTIVTTQPAHDRFIQKLNYDEKEGSLWFLIRLGYSEEPARSLRLDVQDILIASS